MKISKSNLSGTFHSGVSITDCSSEFAFPYIVIFYFKDVIKKSVQDVKTNFKKFILKTNIYGKFSEVRCKNS
jgi:hypothetical protein